MLRRDMKGLEYPVMAIAKTTSSPMRGAAALSAIAVPWSAFVGAFLYYTLLTLLVLGIANLPALFIAVSYLLPAGLYVGVLCVRAMHALVALPIELGDTPHALQH
jgi:hypothetical protein